MIPPRTLHVDWIDTKTRLARFFPALHLEDGRPVARGTYALDEAGRELDRFLVEIDFGPLAHGELPKVWEIEGRIPRTSNRHINAHNGSACVCLPEDYFLQHPGKFDVVAFLQGPVRDFFVGQAIVERGGPWPHGEWGHEDVGPREWAEGFFVGLSPVHVAAYLKVLAMKDLKGHVECPCGSGRRLRDCHMDLLRLMRGHLPREAAAKCLARIRGQR